MGGALGWVDPVNEISFGYVMNKMDWHVRSPRAVALCRALYESTALIEGR
jgi:CubicO group peptidase (beta-lactamase class C family)